MATYLFAWNPKLWPWPELADLQRKLARRGFVDVEWSSGRTRVLEPGSRAFMVRLGVPPPKGIVGAGYVLTAPTGALHWRPEKAARGTQTQYLMLRLEVLHTEPLIGFDELARPPFSRYRWGIRQSGTGLPAPLADALEALWEERVAQAGRTPATPSRVVPGRSGARAKAKSVAPSGAQSGAKSAAQSRTQSGMKAAGASLGKPAEASAGSPGASSTAKPRARNAIATSTKAESPAAIDAASRDARIGAQAIAKNAAKTAARRTRG